MAWGESEEKFRPNLSGEEEEGEEDDMEGSNLERRWCRGRREAPLIGRPPPRANGEEEEEEEGRQSLRV